MAEIKDRAALESTLRFIEERVKPLRCDNPAVSACHRCNSVYLAKRMRELLSEPPAPSWLASQDAFAQRLRDAGWHHDKEYSDGLLAVWQALAAPGVEGKTND